MEPILPPREKGIIRFTLQHPPPSYSLNPAQKIDTLARGMMSHREQLKLLKNEKAKAKNFRDQHSWKLKTQLNKVQIAFNIKLTQER